MTLDSNMTMDTESSTKGVPLVIPTKSAIPTARLLLHNDLGQVIQQWLIRQSKCTLGSAAGCTLRCEAAGIAPYHALIVVGARQIFVRALAPRLSRGGVPAGELLLTDNENRFEVAGHSFSLLRRSSESKNASAATDRQDSQSSHRRLKFTLARPLEISRQKVHVDTLPTHPVGNELHPPIDSKWVARLVQQAVEPLECQLKNVLGPLAELQDETKKQRAMRKHLMDEANRGWQAGPADSDPTIKQLPSKLEDLAATQSAATEMLSDRIAAVNSQLLAIEQLVQQGAEDTTLAEVAQNDTVQNSAIEQLQSGMISVSNALHELRERQQIASGEDRDWKTSLQSEMSSLRVLTEGIATQQEKLASSQVANTELTSWQSEVRTQFQQLQTLITQVEQQASATREAFEDDVDVQEEIASLRVAVEGVAARQNELASSQVANTDLTNWQGEVRNEFQQLQALIAQVEQQAAAASETSQNDGDMLATLRTAVEDMAAQQQELAASQVVNTELAGWQDELRGQFQQLQTLIAKIEEQTANAIETSQDDGGMQAEMATLRTAVEGVAAQQQELAASQVVNTELAGWRGELREQFEQLQAEIARIEEQAASASEASQDDGVMQAEMAALRTAVEDMAAQQQEMAASRVVNAELAGWQDELRGQFQQLQTLIAKIEEQTANANETSQDDGIMQADMDSLRTAVEDMAAQQQGFASSHVVKTELAGWRDELLGQFLQLQALIAQEQAANACKISEGDGVIQAEMASLRTAVEDMAAQREEQAASQGVNTELASWREEAREQYQQLQTLITQVEQRATATKASSLDDSEELAWKQNVQDQFASVIQAVERIAQGSREAIKASQRVAPISPADINATEDESIQPDPMQGEKSPSLAEPGIAEVEFAEVEFAESEFAESEFAESEFAESEVAESEVAESEVAESEVAESEVAESEFAESEVAESEVAESEVAESEVAESEVAESEVAESEVAESEVAESEVAESEVAESEVAETEPYVSDEVEPLVAEQGSSEQFSMESEDTVLEETVLEDSLPNAVESAVAELESSEVDTDESVAEAGITEFDAAQNALNESAQPTNYFQDWTTDPNQGAYAQPWEAAASHDPPSDESATAQEAESVAFTEMDEVGIVSAEIQPHDNVDLDSMNLSADGDDGPEFPTVSLEASDTPNANAYDSDAVEAVAENWEAAEVIDQGFTSDTAESIRVEEPYPDESVDQPAEADSLDADEEAETDEQAQTPEEWDQKNSVAGDDFDLPVDQSLADCHEVMDLTQDQADSSSVASYQPDGDAGVDDAGAPVFDTGLNESPSMDPTFEDHSAADENLSGTALQESEEGIAEPDLYSAAESSADEEVFETITAEPQQATANEMVGVEPEAEISEQVEVEGESEFVGMGTDSVSGEATENAANSLSGETALPDWWNEEEPDPSTSIPSDTCEEHDGLSSRGGFSDDGSILNDMETSENVVAGEGEDNFSADPAGEYGTLEAAQPESLPSSVDDSGQELPPQPTNLLADAPGVLEGQHDGDDGSVEDYMRKLLARMRGVPEDEVEVAAPESPARHEPSERSENSTRESDTNPAAPTTTAGPAVDAPVTTATEDESETEPFDPDTYVPRGSAPEKDRNLAAMRALANTSARTAIHRSSRKRHFSSILVKACISLIGIIVGIVLLAINGLQVNIGLIATVAAFLVGVIWGYDALSSVKPLIQSSLVLKPDAEEETDADTEVEANDPERNSESDGV